jgi:hypothetical protein
VLKLPGSVSLSISPCRSASQTSPTPRRRNGAQQTSSPLTFASPAEAPTTTDRTSGGRAVSLSAAPAPVDPFLVSAEDAKLPVRPTPQLTSRPTGKLARRRRQAPDSPTPARAVPASPEQTHALARSAPTKFTPPRPGARRAATVAAVTSPRFPVCDDLTDDEGAGSGGARHVARLAALRFDDGPRSSSLAPQTFACVTPTPAHRSAVPAGGVFDMSSDEDSGSPMVERTAMVFGLSQVPAEATTPVSANGKKIVFAGSVWQSSPSPEDLPVPAF